MRILLVSFFGETPTWPCFNQSQGLCHLLLEVSRILALPRDDVQEDDLLITTGIQVKKQHELASQQESIACQHLLSGLLCIWTFNVAFLFSP